MHSYPILYFSMDREDFQESQIQYVLTYERIAKEIKGDTEFPDLKLDFNAGVRLQVPEGDWYVRISDYDSEIIGYEGYISKKVLVSAEKYFIRWHVEVYLSSKKVFEHILNLAGQKVFIFMAGGVLGDTISMLPYVKAFQKYYNCEVALYPPDNFIDVCKQYLPEIELVSEVPKDCYATYCLAVFQLPPYLIPVDSRSWETDLAAMSVLGLPYKTPKIHYYPTANRQIREPYVCIAIQASGIMKRWLNPDGWDVVVDYLKRKGYRVLCIDGSASCEDSGYIINMPAEAEDFTGMLPLQERINLLAYADFFVGLGSGLSWLAWACDIPVVLISGFSLPMGEFYTPYRVTNQLLCHGCYNDLRVNWKDKCPYHKGTDREYECVKKISSRQVITAIERLIADRIINPA